MAKTENGGGSIRQRKDGTWEARFTVRTDPSTGKLVRRSLYGKNKKELRKRMEAERAKVENGTYVDPSKLTVAQWLDEWYSTYCVFNCKPYTQVTYRGIIDNHIKPRPLGNKKLQAVRGSDIQHFYADLQANHFSPKTVINMAAVLHKAFDTAVNQDLISFNPCDKADLPDVPQHEIKPLTDADIPAFLSAIDTSPYRNAFALCLFAGLREGECLGLSWDMVDFDKQQITVSQQLQKGGKGEGYVIRPFTKSNKARCIKPPAIAFDYLKAERQKQRACRFAAGAEWQNPHNLVFTTDMGRNVAIPTFYRSFKAIAASIGRPDARPHDLRHSCATIAIAAGADIKFVQDLMGHSTPSFTLQVYAHTSEKMKEDTAARMGDYFANLSVAKPS